MFDPFKLDDESRLVNDHVKAGYGLITMLNEIAYTYKFASSDVFNTVRIFFLHAKKNKLRFWSFEMPAPGLYMLVTRGGRPVHFVPVVVIGITKV
ncbi:hypothetical protein CU097_008000 [Rhizopus azygosporus]|uniref:Uncharacterized protein n=1 Tax=Rhizopus azygosporus TaxID=86630 RepID=A0A367JQJ7_RHIAZ|nr:hypothetical protein CU097_008000 [Rhizopus azygosporus]